ncbi:hypothetical protein V8G54_028575 [Vigna mungo]|uniref:Uncharacterized protein n=1 Tax=Vigna mungo TaxID=3915 RepID=A0AAQ3MT78_VIGMU
MGDTTVNRVSDASLGFVSDCDHCLKTIVIWYTHEQLGNVASSENLMNGCESSRSLFGAKVGCKDAVCGTFSSQELACPTGRSKGRRSSIVCSCCRSHSTRAC